MYSVSPFIFFKSYIIYDYLGLWNVWKDIKETVDSGYLQRMRLAERH